MNKYLLLAMILISLSLVIGSVLSAPLAQLVACCTYFTLFCEACGAIFLAAPNKIG